jgi:uncharacterized protein GlcG (DUF336 family)
MSAPHYYVTDRTCVCGRGEDKEIIGAVGVTGDASDNDEATALAGLAAAGLEADPS